MVDVAQLGIQVNSGPAVKAAGDLDRLTVSATKADAAADRLASNSGKIAPAMAGAGQGSRMFAMQLSQVAQQASATGNFVQALAIQLPDMAMGFGAVGIAAGIVASVALPALASAMLGGSTAAQELQAAMSDMDEAVSNFTEAVSAANVPTEELIEKYGRLESVAQRALQAMAAVDQVEAINAINASIAESLGLITEVGRINARADGQLFLSEDFGLAATEAERLTQALRALEGAQGLQAQAQAADQVQRQLIQAYGSVQAMPAPMQKVYDAMAQVALQAAQTNGAVNEMPGLLNSAAAAADAVAGAVGSIAGAAQSAADAVAGLAARLWEAAQARAEAALDVQNDTGGMAAQYAQYGRGRAAGERLSRESGSLYGGNSVLPSRGGGGGGGGAADQYAADLQALTDSLQSEREVVDAWYAEGQALLADRRSQEILGLQGHHDAMLALEAEYQDRLAEVQGSSQQQRLTDTASYFGSIAGILQAGGQRTAKITATFAAIEGTVNAYAAAIDAARKAPTIAGKFSAYASVLATGLRGVAAIRAAGGAAGGSGGGATAIAAQGATTSELQTVEYQVKGIDKNAFYTGEMWATIFDGITEEAQKRGLQTAIRFV